MAAGNPTRAAAEREIGILEEWGHGLGADIRLQQGGRRGRKTVIKTTQTGATRSSRLS